MILDQKTQSKVIIFIIALGVLAMIILILVVPRAEIIITLNQKIIKQSYLAKLSTTINYPIISLGLIPGKKQKIGLDQPAESWTFSNQDILNYVRDRLEREIKPPEHLITDTLSFSVEMEDADAGKIRIYAEGIVVPDLDIDALKRELVGARFSNAINYLKNLPPVKEVDIKPKPIKFFCLPFLKSRIKISVNAR